MRKCSLLGRQSAVVVVAEPAAIGLAMVEPKVIALAEAAGTAPAAAEPPATGLAVVEPKAIALAEAEAVTTAPAAAEPAASGSAAADSLVTHPVSVALAVQGPVSVASAVAAPVSAESADQAQVFGGSAECSGILRQRQAADGRQTQEAGRSCSYQPLSPERLGAYAWSLAALHGLLCFDRSNSLDPLHSRPAHLDAHPRSPRRG